MKFLGVKDTKLPGGGGIGGAKDGGTVLEIVRT